MQKSKGNGYPWWAAPHALLGFFLAPALILMFAISDRVLQQQGLPNYLTFERKVGSICLLLVVAVSAFIGKSIRVPALRTNEIPDFSFDIFAILCLAAYGIWFMPVISNPMMMLDILTGSKGAVYASREALQTVPGVTTFTQAGVAYITGYAYRLADGSPLVRKRYSLYLWAIVALAVVRTVVNSERLALLEVLIPPLLVLSPKLLRSGGLRGRLVIFGPYVGIIGLFLLFAATESVRSWSNHYQYLGGSLYEFVAHRLSAYYVLAINTGFGAIDTLAKLSDAPFFSLQWLYKMPFIGGEVLEWIQPYDPTALVLSVYADPEFSNISGLAAYIWDFGWLGAALFMSCIGVVVGLSWRGVVRASGFLRYFYPVLFLSLLEILRIPYLTSGRAFVAILCVAAMVALGWISKRPRTLDLGIPGSAR